MADRPRRRFPWLALLGVALVAALVVILLVEVGVLPERTDVWVNLNSAEVEYRGFVCGFPVGVERPESLNLVAHQCARVSCENQSQSAWVITSRWHGWRGSYKQTWTQYGYVERGLDLMSRWVTEDKLLVLPSEVHVVMSEPASGELAVQFVDVLHKHSAAAVLTNYYKASVKRFIEADQEITPAEVIPSDTWLADPVPEHYYGPGRIH